MFKIFWLQFCEIGGSGEPLSIFVHVESCNKRWLMTSYPHHAFENIGSYKRKCQSQPEVASLCVLFCFVRPTVNRTCLQQGKNKTKKSDQRKKWHQRMFCDIFCNKNRYTAFIWEGPLNNSIHIALWCTWCCTEINQITIVILKLFKAPWGHRGLLCPVSF